MVAGGGGIVEMCLSNSDALRQQVLNDNRTCVCIAKIYDILYIHIYIHTISISMYINTISMYTNT